MAGEAYNGRANSDERIELGEGGIGAEIAADRRSIRG